MIARSTGLRGPRVRAVGAPAPPAAAAVDRGRKMDLFGRYGVPE